MHGEGYILETVVNLWNHGKTPAVITNVVVGFSEKPVMYGIKRLSAPTMGFMLGANKEPHGAGTFSLTLSAEDWSKIQSTTKHLFCGIRLEWEDVF